MTPPSMSATPGLATVIDPAAVATEIRAKVATQVDAVAQRRGHGLRVVGLLTQTDGPARVYAEYAVRGCQEVGITMDLREVTHAETEAVLREANGDPDVDGLFLYYPLIDPVQDRWLRELVDPRKDIEGMHSFWSRLLYENRRHLEGRLEARAILPCTPLAILKLLQYAGMRGSDTLTAPLEGVRACVINRSDIVGRPLSAMLANDGAEVVSLDLTGSVVFEPAIGRHSHVVRDATITRREALRDADLVITGVPSRDFPLVQGEEIKPGAICVNFSQYRNFDDSILDTASAFVPRVGPMTVTMATRNLVRLLSMDA